jgi:transglutaminase-like putative cysteine protease
MPLSIRAHLDYHFAQPTDVLLQLEAAATAEQQVHDARFDLPQSMEIVRVAGHDGVGERAWVRAEGSLTLDYRATVTVNRSASAIADLPRLPPHLLPENSVQYLLPSRYCPSDRFEHLVAADFAGLDGGALVAAVRDWVRAHFSYVPGVSTSDTTALDSFVKRQGICRDYAHVVIALVRAAGIPARIASVYALGVVPQDFHAVAEVFLDGAWHLVDATGMAGPGEMAIIGVGRDAADVAFMTAFGWADFRAQQVRVEAA